jgi:hypothetical protein
MAGTPTEAQIVSQWKAAVDVLETTRNFADGTMAASAGKFNALETILIGDFLPVAMSNFTDNMRAALSSMLTPNGVAGVLSPVVYEYMRILAADATAGMGTGSGFRSFADAFRALYEWYVQKGFTIKSRTITFDTTGTTGNSNTVAGVGTIVGNGSMSRLTVDQNNFNLEACNVEKKTFRCIQDQNTGADKEAERFQFIGAAASFDSLLRTTNAHGSGEASRTTFLSKHAGTGDGGSLLNNSSFSDYNASNTPKFSNWTEKNNGAQVSQDTTNFYRDYPGSQISGSLKITSSGSLTVTVTQSTSQMRIKNFDPNTPYFLRVMVNKTIGTAVGGNVVVRFGSQTVTTSIASLGANWAEIIVPIGQNHWPKNFDANALTIEIEWAMSASTGYLLVDDCILCPWMQIDGTYWILRQKSATGLVNWKLDDTLIFTDTGGAPATGKLQYYLFLAGFGYLPSSGSPTYADP